MLFRPLLALALVAPVATQNFYVPDNLANAGTCNVIPLGGAPGFFDPVRYQTLVTAADLNNLPAAITGLGFASCGTGRTTYGTIEVWMDNIPSATLSTTFANNLTPAAVLVLQATDYTWQQTADTWVELGLQNYFVYNGVDNLVIDITITGATGNLGGNHRDTRQRVYAINWIVPPTLGSSDSAALKMEIGAQMARASVFGRGCRGSNLLTPTISFSGTPQLGQSFSFELLYALANSGAFLMTGFGNGAPFPLELTNLGLPGCYQFFNLATTAFAATNAAGAATIAVTVPNRTSLVGMLFYAQWACIDARANPGGATVSDYGRVLVGN